MIVRGAPLALAGLIFFFVGLPFAIVFPIISLGTGEALFAFIGGGLGGLFALLGGMMLYFGAQRVLAKVRTLQHGRATVGRIVSIEKDHSIQINGRYPWRVAYAFEVGAASFEGYELSWKYAEAHQAPGNVVHVLYEPENPEKNTLYPPVT